jgi:hypothetical protein
MKRLCWDLDYIKYSIGSACETRSIIVTHKNTGDQKEFKSRTNFYGHWKTKSGGWLAEVNAKRLTPFVFSDFIIQDKQVAEPVEYALQTVKNHISGIKKKLGVDNYYGYIGRGDSWRVGASTILEYKGDRKNNLKPLLLDEIEDYLLKHHNAIEVRNKEADDQCVIDCYQNDSHILCGVDKDYNGSEVTFFNVDKSDKPLRIRGLGSLWLDDKSSVRGIGRKFFYHQIMSGDSSDCYFANSATDKKWGDKSSFKLLEPCTTDAECWQSIVNGYKALYPEPSKFIGWRGDELDITWDYVLNENCQMAHMLRFDGDKFNLYPLLDKLGVEY